MNLVAQLLSVIFSILIAKLAVSGKVLVWKILLLDAILSKISSALFVHSSKKFTAG